MPLPMMVESIEAATSDAAALDFLVALGTHQPMTDEQLGRLVGRTVVRGAFGRSRIFNHRWDDPASFACLGSIPAEEVRALTDGRLDQSVEVALNRLIFDYDQLLICGPVFPHEVVGFSGGNKYLFPGIAGGEIINFTHWLGALIGNYHVIGAGYTPVRAVIDRAATLVPRPTACLALVVTHDALVGLYFGSPEAAWQSASALSSQDPHRPRRQAVHARALGHARDVRRPVDGGERACTSSNPRWRTAGKWSSTPRTSPR